MGQAEFARATNIPKPTLSRWLAAQYPPIRPANIVRLAKGLGVPPAEIESKLKEARPDSPRVASMRRELCTWFESMDDAALLSFVQNLRDLVSSGQDSAEVDAARSMLAAIDSPPSQDSDK